jgi:DNA polymerase-3 subunit epsilon
VVIGRRLPDRPWRSVPAVVVDVEATSLDPRTGELLSIGLVPVDDGRVRAAGAREWRVRPSRPPTDETVVVHGLRPSDVRGATPPAEVAPQVAAAVAGRVVIAHSAWVERRFLAPLLAGHGPGLPEPLLDTEALGRLWLLERDGRAPPRLALGALAAALGVPVERRHHALGDALTAAQCYLALASHLDAARPRTVRDLARAAAVLRSSAAFGT